MVKMLQTSSKSFMKDRLDAIEKEKYQNPIYREYTYTHVLETQIKMKNILIDRLTQRIIELQDEISAMKAMKMGASDKLIEILRAN